MCLVVFVGGVQHLCHIRFPHDLGDLLHLLHQLIIEEDWEENYLQGLVCHVKNGGFEPLQLFS